MHIFDILLGRELATWLGAVFRYWYLRLRGKKVKFSEILNGRKKDDDIDKTFNSSKNYYIALAIGFIIMIIVFTYRKYFMIR